MKPGISVGVDAFKKPGASTNMKQTDPTFFEQSLDSLDIIFRDKFSEPHRRLKASIHKCQSTAYSQQGLSLEESERVARTCFLPLLLIRRHA